MTNTVTDAIKKADTRYLAFAVEMLLCERNEGIEIERTYDAPALYRSESADTTAETVRPSK